MMDNTERLSVYLSSLINSVFKILPLYEEQNFGVHTYIESLMFELYGLDDVLKIDDSAEYIAILSNLASLKREVSKVDSSKTVVKREVFKSINIIKSMLSNIGEDNDLL